MSSEILRFEDILEKKTENKTNLNTNNSLKATKKKEKNELVIPKGVPVSGRIWKSPKKRFSSVIKTRGYKTANRFEKLQLVKKEINRIRDLSKRIVEERKREIEAKKERRRLNLQRKEANRLKSEIVQVIKNPAKIKRMRKKQLRQIEKRDTLNMK